MATLSQKVVAGEYSSEAALTHAWRYFELHANQRMSVFNFFLALSGVVSSYLGILLGSLLAMVSFIFWKLDERVSFLIKHAEAALSELEGVLPNEQARLFLGEPSKTRGVTSGYWWSWSRHWTYGQCFRTIFVVMAIIGIGGSVLSMFRLVGILCW